MSYRQLLERFAKVSGDVNLFLPVPFISPKLVGTWVGMLSRQAPAIVEALLEGLGNDVVCHEQQTGKLIPCALTPLDKVIAAVLDKCVL